MRTSLAHLRRDERGMSLVFVGIGLMALLSATTLAIDVGMFMAARNQAQNSADAGALAGAGALAFNSYTDRTSGGPAVQSAINGAKANPVIGAQVSINPADVTFPTNPSGVADLVKVTVYRTGGRANPVGTLMGVVFGVNTVDIGATATAEAAPADAETCVLPFTIPDKWIENSQPGGWQTTSTFDMYDKKGKLLPNADTYVPPGSSSSTGYSPVYDRGLEMVLKQDNTGKIAPSFYNPWDLPGSVGGSDYSNNIATCNTQIFKKGDNMPPENGNMVGPTIQGVQALIARDPTAIWDTGCKCVKNSAFPTSPRVGVVPLYDPVAYAQGQQSGKGITLTMVNYLGFFIEGMQGNDVVGYITPISGLVSGGGGPTPIGAFPVAIRLVQ